MIITTAQLDAQAQAAEKDRRRARTEQGRGPVQHTARQENKRKYKRSRANDPRNW